MNNKENVLSEGIPLSKAIRLIQDELIKSQNERENSGIPPLFKVEKLTIEANCIFKENEDSSIDTKVNILSLLSNNINLNKNIGHEYIQKITLELIAKDFNNKDFNNKDQQRYTMEAMPFSKSHLPRTGIMPQVKV